MQIFTDTADEYFDNLPQERKVVMDKLREVIKTHIPDGFVEMPQYGMVGYVVPLETYPAGYGRDKLPLPFVALASQKNHIALYHMGIYSNNKLLEWFKQEYEKTVPTKLDMGKGCIRFKNIKHIPYDLIGELLEKIDVKSWIAIYEESIIKK